MRNNAEYKSSRLPLVATSGTEKKGIWPFRTAMYAVSVRDKQDFEYEVFVGRFRNPQQAMHEANKFLTGEPK